MNKFGCNRGKMNSRFLFINTLWIVFCSKIDITVQHEVDKSCTECFKDNPESLTPPGDLGTGFTFSDSYVNTLCTYLEDVVDCSTRIGLFGKETCEMDFTPKLARFYQLTSDYLCVQPQLTELKGLLQCLNDPQIQYVIYQSITKIGGGMEAIYDLDKVANLTTEEKGKMYCDLLDGYLHNIKVEVLQNCGTKEADAFDKMISTVTSDYGFVFLEVPKCPYTTKDVFGRAVDKN